MCERDSRTCMMRARLELCCGNWWARQARVATSMASSFICIPADQAQTQLVIWHSPLRCAETCWWPRCEETAFNRCDWCGAWLCDDHATLCHKCIGIYCPDCCRTLHWCPGYPQAEDAAGGIWAPSPSDIREICWMPSCFNDPFSRCHYF